MVCNKLNINSSSCRFIEHLSFNIAQDPDITTQQSGTTMSENSMITLKGMFYMSFDVLMPRNLTL